MTKAPMIGHVIINCSSCGEPRHVPVTCEAVPVAREDTYTWKVTRRGKQVGQMHLAFAPLPDDHQCLTGCTKPAGPLRLVKASDDED